jgi:hypothetical protein
VSACPLAVIIDAKLLLRHLWDFGLSLHRTETGVYLCRERVPPSCIVAVTPRVTLPAASASGATSVRAASPVASAVPVPKVLATRMVWGGSSASSTDFPALPQAQGARPRVPSRPAIPAVLQGARPRDPSRTVVPTRAPVAPTRAPLAPSRAPIQSTASVDWAADARERGWGSPWSGGAFRGRFGS